ncbi:MAG: patatin-like phospholipase family protein [Firmicutes bacterium]|nr:patatin-like phospholipase family protein [Bacillota bacterium]
MPLFPVKKTKTALVLSGGGTRGFAHLGVIKAFDEANIKFDIVAGTSVGSLVGAFYCAGLTFETILKVASGLAPKQIHHGIIPNDPMRVGNIIKSVLGNKRFEDLKIPFYVVAVNLRTGQEVIIDKGLLYEAVAASCAVPIFYRPFVKDDMHLVDGGILNNIPADVARMMGADKVVSIDINANRGHGTDSLSLINVAKVSLAIMISNSSQGGLINSDIIISPDLSKFKATKVDGAQEMIELGYSAAKEKIDEIRKISLK